MFRVPGNADDSLYDLQSGSGEVFHLQWESKDRVSGMRFHWKKTGYIYLYFVLKTMCGM